MSKEERHLGVWLSPDQEAAAGVLTIIEDDHVELELLSQQMRTDFQHHGLIRGFTAGEIYSLLHLQNTSFGVRMGSSLGSTDIYWIGAAIKGAHLDSENEAFPRFSFTVGGIQEWSRLTGIAKESVQVQGSKKIDRTYTRSTPDTVEIECGDLTFRFVPVTREPGTKWSISLQEDTVVEVHAKHPKTVDEWVREVALPFQRLFRFVAKTGGTLRRLAISTVASPASGVVGRDWFNVIWFGNAYPLDERSLRLDRPFLLLSDFVENPDALAKWFGLERQYREPLTAVLDSDLGRPTEEYVFFVHARLLERLVNYYPKSELCDKETIEKIVEFAATLVPEENREVLAQKIRSQRRNDAKVPLVHALRTWLPMFEGWSPSEEEIDWIATAIIKTRNFFAHQGSSRPDPKRIQVDEFAVFTYLARTIIDFEVAQVLGFSTQEVRDRLDNSRQWRNARIVREVWQDRGSEV